MPRGRSRSSGIQSLVLALALAGGAVIAFKPSGRALEGRASVTDGDTIHIGDAKIRLKGIDAPEMDQVCSHAGRSYRCGDVARRALIDIVSGEQVQCRAAGRDRYQRVLARCTVKGTDIGARMVEEGWAVSYGRDYDLQERRAQGQGAGLWAGEFERPQEWRRSRAGD
ncbi:MAG TPA: thermonuclease family protein [Microvirga sp.]|nr:thermonuclease family protein [Microvirga sp.]